MIDFDFEMHAGKVSVAGNGDVGTVGAANADRLAGLQPDGLSG